MSLRRKLEGETEIRATAADVIHEIVKSKPHHISNMASHFVQGVDLLEGDDYGIIGSKSVWNITLDGKPQVATAILEEYDEEKKYAKYRTVEGELMKDYKSFVGTFQVTPKDSETCIAKWTLEYEKVHPSSPEPSAVLETWLDALKHMDDYHHGITN